jgi:aminoglycoside phosphotransferase (APT) family kinase protein
MTIHPTPPAEVVVDAPLVRALLLEQHPDLADLPITDGHAGWDNQVYRLGDALAVRLPRRAAAATLIVREQQWLPLLAPRLPLPISAPARVGRPGHGFRGRGVVPWFEGESGAATRSTPFGARDLGRFLRALHRPAPPDGGSAKPVARVRFGIERYRWWTVDVSVTACRVRVPRPGSASCARPHGPRRRWIHGDMHPGLLRDSVVAVIDFGDLAADPATDLSVAWMTMFSGSQAGIPRRGSELGQPHR